MSISLTRKQQYWYEHLQKADRSGSSLADYARLNDIPPQKLYQWRNTLKAQVATEITTETRFTQVMTPPNCGPSLTLRLGDAPLARSILVRQASGSNDMMRPSPALPGVYLCIAPVDFRKSVV